MFTKEDLQQIEQQGLTQAQVEQQIENFRKGFPYLNIVRAAAAGDGVLVMSDEEIAKAEARYEEASANIKVVKFVPASGAATRMFKELFEYVNDDKRTSGIDKLLDNIEKFAFWPELSKYIMPDSPDEEIVESIVKTGLCYGSKPKGLVTFHSYPEGNRKAVEEHLVEGALYARSGDDDGLPQVLVALDVGGDADLVDDAGDHGLDAGLVTAADGHPAVLPTPDLRQPFHQNGHVTGLQHQIADAQPCSGSGHVFGNKAGRSQGQGTALHAGDGLEHADAVLFPEHQIQHQNVGLFVQNGPDGGFSVVGCPQNLKTTGSLKRSGQPGAKLFGAVGNEDCCAMFH